MKIKHLVQMKIIKEKDLLIDILKRYFSKMESNNIIDAWSIHDSISSRTDDEMGISMRAKKKIVIEILFSSEQQYQEYMTHREHKALISELETNNFINIRDISHILRTIDYKYSDML